MTFTLKSSIALLITIVLFCAALIIGTNVQRVEGASYPGSIATMGTTSNPIVVALTSRVLFATSTCASRVISTASTSIMLTFGDYPLQTPSAGYGLFQAASTTVVYDAEVYGCGLVKAFPFNSGILTISESR